MKRANWIHCKDELGNAVPLYQRCFSKKNEVKSAFLYLSARGVYEAFLNGKRVGDFVFAPGWTSYEKRIQYQKYEITSLLSEENELVVSVGFGWYKGPIAKWWCRQKSHKCALIAKIEICYANGVIEEIVSDTDWKAAKSGYAFSEIYDGFEFDARIEPDFCLETQIAENNSKEELILQVGEKVIEQERISPIEIITTPKGETVLDFGQNHTGYVEIALSAKAGDSVSLSFAEVLDCDGNFYNENYRTAKSKYRYICKEGFQTFKPKHTFYGYRYVRLDAWPAEVKKDSFASIAVYSDLERTGFIESSDAMLNRFFSNVLWGQKSNFLDVPTDCPQRNERMGWTGDVQVFCRAASYNYNVNRFFEKWLGDMALDQYEDGSVPMVVPFEQKECQISAAWGDAVSVCPWQLYLSYGNREVLKTMFLPIKKWVDYITSVTKKPNLWLGGEDHFGDWLELGAEKGQYKGDTRDDLIASAFYARSTEILCKIGRILGEDISEYEELYQRIRLAFQQEFEGTYKTQTEHLLALEFNLAKHPEALANELAELICREGTQLQTGFVGTPYVLPVLSRFGYHRLAYTLLLRKEYPSWFYPITKGATTVWEHWDGIMPDGSMWSSDMNSFNHYAYGAAIDWVYSVCGGINPVEEAPGYEKALIAPVPDDRIDWLKVKLKTAHGTILSAWRHEKGRVIYEITTPVKSTVIIEGKKYELEAGSYTF